MPASYAIARTLERELEPMFISPRYFELTYEKHRVERATVLLFSLSLFSSSSSLSSPSRFENYISELALGFYRISCISFIVLLFVYACVSYFFEKRSSMCGKIFWNGVLFDRPYQILISIKNEIAIIEFFLIADNLSTCNGKLNLASIGN